MILQLALILSLVAAHTTDSSKMVLWIFREDCYNKFINMDFADMECVKFTISKGLGFAIVVGSGILKVPQIIKIVMNGSVEGLAAISTYIEVSFTISQTLIFRP